MLAKKLKNCRKFFSIHACLLAGLFANQGLAFTLGDIRLESALNEPLRANIELLELNGLNEAQILVNLGSEADFERVGVDPLPLLNDLEFDVVVLSSAEGLVRITTSEAIVEPYLNFVLNVRWPSGRVIREYTVLLDLPTFSSSPIPTPAPAPAITRPTPIPQAEPAPRNSVPPAPIAQPTPAPQPAQEVVTEPTPAPAPRSEPATNRAPETVVIQTGDSLWNIALATRPGNDVSVQQMMLAIQRANSNSDAFIANNINGIRAGRVLRIPSRQEINAIGQEQAINQVAVQNQQFNINAQPLALNNSQGPVAGTSRDELSIIAGTNAENTDRTQISGLNETIRNLENELALSDENLDRALLENEELRSRLGDLEEEIGILENIIAIENQRMAELQAELAARQEAESAGVLATASAEPVTSSENTANTVVNPTPQAAETGIVDQIRGFLSSTIGMITGLVLILALVVGFLITRNRMNGRDEDDFDAMLEEEDAGSDFELDSAEEAALFNEVVEDDADTDTLDDAEAFGSEDGTDDSDTSTNDTSDSEQDEELFSDDEEDDSYIDDEDAKPGFLAGLFAKFSRKKNQSDSDEEAEDFEDAEDYEEENDEPGFYDESDTETDDSESADEDEVMSIADVETDEESDEDFNIKDFDPDDDIDEDLDTDEAVDIEDEIEEKSAENADVSNDEHRKDPTEAALAPSDVEEISFEGDFADTDDSEESIEFEDLTIPDEIADENSDSSSAEKEKVEDVFEFKLDDEIEQNDKPDEVDEIDSKDVESFEFSIADESDSAKPAEEEIKSKQNTEIETLDFGDFAITPAESDDNEDSNEIEFIEEEKSSSELADVTENKGSKSNLRKLGLDEAFATDESDEDELDVITDQDEVSTKLDLAVAYQAMDDLDGAREILDEVIAEGNEEQIAEAQRLLSKWGEA